MEPVYFPEDETYRIYCDFCDRISIDRYCNIISNHKHTLITVEKKLPNK